MAALKLCVQLRCFAHVPKRSASRHHHIRRSAAMLGTHTARSCPSAPPRQPRQRRPHQARRAVSAPPRRGVVIAHARRQLCTARRNMHHRATQKQWLARAHSQAACNGTPVAATAARPPSARWRQQRSGGRAAQQTGYTARPGVLNGWLNLSPNSPLNCGKMVLRRALTSRPRIPASYGPRTDGPLHAALPGGVCGPHARRCVTPCPGLRARRVLRRSAARPSAACRASWRADPPCEPRGR